MKNKKRWTNKQKALRNMIASAKNRGDFESVSRYEKMFNEEYEK